MVLWHQYLFHIVKVQVGVEVSCTVPDHDNTVQELVQFVVLDIESLDVQCCFSSSKKDMFHLFSSLSNSASSSASSVASSVSALVM